MGIGATPLETTAPTAGRPVPRLVSRSCLILTKWAVAALLDSDVREKDRLLRLGFV